MGDWEMSRRGGYLVFGLLIGALANPRLAHANDSSKGSEGSNDSSKNSGDSSKNSGDSSKRSGDSSERSPENSTRGSTDETSNSKQGQALSVALVLVTVGSAVLGGALVTRATNRQNEQRQVQALVRFLRKHHGMVARDVLLAEGPLLSAWADALGLSPVERDRLTRAMDGSAEQAQLLQALDGPIDAVRARRFAAGFASVSRRAVGPQRFQAIALAAGP
jgi:hypothetical protein